MVISYSDVFKMFKIDLLLTSYIGRRDKYNLMNELL